MLGAVLQELLVLRIVVRMEEDLCIVEALNGGATEQAQTWLTAGFTFATLTSFCNNSRSKLLTPMLLHVMS